MLAEPLLKGTTWTSTGGAQNDVASTSTTSAPSRSRCPAFPQPVLAAKVSPKITQAGALGDPYGSGVRTVWWVYGVGPVKIVFEHAGGTGAPVTTRCSQSTNQTPQTPPTDVDYFPLKQGLTGTYRWTNTKYLKQPEVERVHGRRGRQRLRAGSRLTSVSGPIKVEGAYGYTHAPRRRDEPLRATTKAASLAKLPPLGPTALPPAQRRHFFTPFDLMDFGFGPILPAYPRPATRGPATRAAATSTIYGVTGTTKVARRADGEGAGGDVQGAGGRTSC